MTISFDKRGKMENKTTLANVLKGVFLTTERTFTFYKQPCFFHIYTRFLKVGK